MSLVAEDCNDKLDDLSKHQLDILQDWETKFQEKYEVVGQVCFASQEALLCLIAQNASMMPLGHSAMFDAAAKQQNNLRSQSQQQHSVSNANVPDAPFIVFA